MRVVSLVPSATETIYKLGAFDEVVGVTYACDTPADARTKDVVVRPIYNMDGLSEAEIDKVVSGGHAKGESLYILDIEKIRNLRPDLIVVQSVCDVCAASTRDFNEDFRSIARVIEVGPRGVGEILSDILTLGEALGRSEEAHDLVENIRGRIGRIAENSKSLEKRRVFFMEWLDPPFCSGHWVPELVELAGGIDLGFKGAHSRRVSEKEITGHNPEIIIAGPCGFNLEKAYIDAQRLKQVWWASKSVIYAVDGGRYFSRHGPGIAEAVEILAEIIHPEIFRGVAPENTFRQV